MSVLEAVILGIVQGIAEFLPVSSSGHLVILERVFGITGPVMTFDIVVHLGSLVAVLVVFRKDILNILKNPFSKMTGLLIVGTIPAVLAALLFKDAVESVFRTGVPLALAFLVTAALLVLADRAKEGDKESDGITFLDALVVGCMQAVGIPPGISRSGATITGALYRGLTRESAARFSLLLSIIAIAGAGVLECVDIIKEPSLVSVGALPMIFGFVSSALVGYLAIQWLLRLIKSCKLKYFAYYVAVLAVLILIDTLGTRIFFGN